MKRLILAFLLLCSFVNGQEIYDCNLWGLGYQAAGSGTGTIFSYNIDKDTLVNRATLTWTASGAMPKGSLMKASDGSLYGLTWAGGTGVSNTLGNCNGCGAMIEYDLQNDSLVKRFDFDWDSGPGGMPSAAMIEATDGYFYGTTNSGILTPDGAIFRYDPVAKTTSALYIFSNAVGHGPQGTLLDAGNGDLYGFTVTGAFYGDGSLFKYNTVSNTFTKLHDFNGPVSGKNPGGELIKASNGLLYGLTPRGGQFSNGVLFSYDISTNTFTKLIDFHFTTGGYYPEGSLLQSSNGKLYGLLSKGGTYNLGTLFEYDITTNSVQTKFNFNTSTGRNPIGSLMQASNGKLYGVTQLGAGASGGSLFEYDFGTDTVIKKADLTLATGYRPQNLRLLEVCELVGVESLSITAPNIFSPNGDGINDTWNLLVNFRNLVISADISIFNRWGEPVFGTKDLSIGWDGKNKSGLNCPDGTYYFAIIYTDRKKHQKTLKGFISLTR